MQLPRRWRAACGVVLFLMFILPASTSAEAGWGGLIEDIIKVFSRSEPALVRTGVLGAEEAGLIATPLTRLVLGEKLAARLSGQDTRQFEAAVARMDQAKIPPLEEALGLVANGSLSLDKSMPFADNLPFLRIRATGIANYDDALVEFARAKLTPTLSQRFSVSDLRIIPFGMSEDATISTQEIAHYSAWLPEAQRDISGPLARLARGEMGELDAIGKANALAPYRGQTVVLVGHMPAADDRFIAWTANGIQHVDLSAWMAAAKKAEVNLIPIGCNSGHFLPFGAAEFVNSSSVLERLIELIGDEPKTMGEFLAKLSGDDLEMLINPIEINIFDNTVEILKRESAERVGRIITNLERQAPSMVEQIYGSVPKAAPTPNYGPCFTQEDAAAFDVCANDAQHSLEASLAAEAKAAAAKAAEDSLNQRNRLLEHLPGARTRAAVVEDKALRIFVLWILCFLVLWTLAALAAPYSYLVCGLKDVAPGLSIWRAFTDATILKTFLPIVFTQRYWRQVARSEGYQVLPFMCGIGLLGIAIWNVWDYDPSAQLLGGIAIFTCFWMLFVVAINLIRSNVGSPVWLGFLPTLLMLGAAWAMYVSGETFGSAREDVRDLARTWSAVTSDSPEVWQKEAEFLPDDVTVESVGPNSRTN